jgi:hypothetical protein
MSQAGSSGPNVPPDGPQGLPPSPAPTAASRSCSRPSLSAITASWSRGTKRSIRSGERARSRKLSRLGSPARGGTRRTARRRRALRLAARDQAAVQVLAHDRRAGVDMLPHERPQLLGLAGPGLLVAEAQDLGLKAGDLEGSVLARPRHAHEGRGHVVVAIREAEGPAAGRDELRKVPRHAGVVQRGDQDPGGLAGPRSGGR